MRRKKLASGVMMLALLGFTAERSHAEEVVIDQEQEVVEQGQGEVIVDQEQDVDTEQEQEVIVDQGQETVVVDQEQEVVVDQEQIIIDPKKGGYHPPIGQCKASNPPGPKGQCLQPHVVYDCKKQDELTPIIQTGECWSQCIYPGQTGMTYKPIKTCIDCDQVVPNGTTTVTKKVVVKIARDLNRKCIEKPSGHYEYKVVWSKPRRVTIADCTPKTIPPNQCHPVKQSIQVAYERPTILTDIITHTISFPYSWEDLYRRPVPCPPNGKGGTDCSSVCNETTTRTKKVGIDKCIDKPGTITAYITKYYDVMVCEPTKPPQCPTKTVVVRDPHIIKVPIMEKVCKYQPGPSHNIYGPVTFQVPQYKVVPKPPVIDCVGVPTQVCKPVLVWRQEAMCLNDGKNHSSLIVQVQEALVQEGFDAGPANGVMNDKTKQAVVEFQKAKGLAQGGTLTKETVEALGISQ